MESKILAWAAAQQLFSPGQTVLCAVSGGADSVCMLHVLLALRKTLGVEVEAAHFHHGLRAQEADRDEAFVRSLCHSLGVPLRVGRADVRSAAAQSGESEEEAARRLRYAFLTGFGLCVATAHNADDNLETILLNLVRGTSLKGLCGIPPKRDGVVRPMLAVTRAEIEAYLAARGLFYLTDSTNLTDGALRNRLRHHVLPLLRAENPKLLAACTEMSGRLSQDEAYLDAQANAALRAAGTPGGYDCRLLRTLPAPLRTRALRAALYQAHVEKPTAKHIAALDRMLLRADGTECVCLPGGRRAVRCYQLLQLDPPPPVQGFAPVLLLPGCRYEIPELQCTVRCEAVNFFEKSGNCPSTFFVDYASIEKEGGLLLRPRLPGDRISLPGGTKSLKKLLIDRKIPANLRAGIPVLAAGAHVAAVPGVAEDGSFAARRGFPAWAVTLEYHQNTKEKEDSEV